MTEATYHGDARVTPEALAALRARIGVKHPIKPWNNLVVEDNIWHFCEAYGDDNPLYTDPGYARKSRWGGITAPPTFLLSCSSAGGGGGHGLAGVFGLWARDEWEWYQPVRPGDLIHGYTELVDVREKHSTYAGRMFNQIDRVTYINQRDEVVGRKWQHNMRLERGPSRERGKYKAITKYKYTLEELSAIEEQYARELVQRRGATPRYWDDTREGEDMITLVKGPLTVTSMVTWLMGWGSPLCKTDRIAHLYMQAHPGARIVNLETNVPDFPEAAHWDEWYARQSGLPGGYDIGGQRISWVAHLVTDWMGDDAFLKRLDVELRRPNIVGDTTWLRGRVVKKSEKDGEHLAECEMWGENQRGEKTTTGRAIVRLPKRQ
ncbi:MAG: MaoC family dehydratase N-terminal domain-containing protein [Chloroflexi bacterium]|nr:MaoC family dehydratase N-terminal domain-containing protein [Chloroflexota bacterium]